MRSRSPNGLVAIGRALQPFPRSKPSRLVSQHSAFQLGQSTRQERIDRCRPRGAPGASSLPSSAFHAVSVGLPLDWLTLADLHRVLTITVRRWATTPPPSALPRAGIFAPHCWEQRCGSSPVPTDDVVATRSCPLYAGCAVKYSWSAQELGQAGIFPFWVRRVSQLRLSVVTTLQTGVPLVSIGHRGSARLTSGLELSRIVRRLRTPGRAAT